MSPEHRTPADRWKEGKRIYHPHRTFRFQPHFLAELLGRGEGGLYLLRQLYILWWYQVFRLESDFAETAREMIKEKRGKYGPPVVEKSVKGVMHVRKIDTFLAQCDWESFWKEFGPLDIIRTLLTKTEREKDRWYVQEVTLRLTELDSIFETLLGSSPEQFPKITLESLHKEILAIIPRPEKPKGEEREILF